VTSQATAIQVTIGAVARTPKMIPNFKKSMMVCKRGGPPFYVRESVHEAAAGPSRGFASLDPVRSQGP
jgi:hypothetical protein